MKKIILWFIGIAVLILVSHPYFSHWYIHHSVLLYAFTLLPYPLLYIPISLLVKEREKRLKNMLSHSRTQSKHYKEQLSDKELQLKQIENYAKSEYIFFQHSPEEAFQIISPSVKNILGYTPEWIQQHYTEIGLEAIDTTYFKKLSQDNKEAKGHIQLKNNNGELIPFQYVVSLNLSEEQIYGFLKKQKKQSLLTQEEQKDLMAQYRLLYESTHNGVILMNQNGVFDCNTAATSILERSPKELQNCNALLVDFSPEYQPSAYSSKELSASYIKVAYKGIEQHFNWTFVNQQGLLIDTQIDLKPFSEKGRLSLMIIITNTKTR